MSSQPQTLRINGEPLDCIPCSDRGLLYGDGVFETLAVDNGSCRYWSRHMARLQAGCERLAIPDVAPELLAAEAEGLVAGIQQGVLKIIVTRGSGGRGYRVPVQAVPTRILQLHPWPDLAPSLAGSGVAARLCNTRLGNNPALAGIKHLNRLEQVLARQEWDDAGILEGLLMDAEGRLVEGTMSNLFLVRDGMLLTPGLQRCGVAGIMRSVILDLAVQQAVATRVCDLYPADLAQADEVFLANSLVGIWPVTAVDEYRFRKGPLTQQLQTLLAVHTEDTGGWRR
jgi:4-amino-4-deoxychorismate lyase